MRQMPHYYLVCCGDVVGDGNGDRCLGGIGGGGLAGRRRTATGDILGDSL